MTPDLLRAALFDPNARAWLRVIRAGESSQYESAYRTMFGGGLFSGAWKHPRIVNSAAGLSSTAAGAYQFLSRTWDECAAALKLPDFSPESQDLAALLLTDRRGALQDVLAGRIEMAIAKCAKEWASLPGSPYGQPTRTLQQALAVYEAYGGTYATAKPETPASGPPDAPSAYPGTIPAGEAPGWEPPAPKERPMAPFIVPAVIELAKMIPKLGGMFGGSEVAQRNVAAAGVVVDAVVGAVGASNAQEAVEKIASDPAAREAANKAVEAVWYQISEAGGGGIDGARKAEASRNPGGDLLHSASFWVGLLLLPLVYLLVLSLIGMIGTATWSDDVRAGLAGSLISAIIGGMVGYYYGTSTSRNRTAP